MNRKIGLDFYSRTAELHLDIHLFASFYTTAIFLIILYIQDVLDVLFSCSLKEERNKISKCYLGTNRLC